jgi:hypothetical protein
MHRPRLRSQPLDTGSTGVRLAARMHQDSALPFLSLLDESRHACLPRCPTRSTVTLQFVAIVPAVLELPPLHTGTQPQSCSHMGCAARSTV